MGFRAKRRIGEPGERSTVWERERKKADSFPVPAALSPRPRSARKFFFSPLTPLGEGTASPTFFLGGGEWGELRDEPKERLRERLTRESPQLMLIFCFLCRAGKIG